MLCAGVVVVRVSGWARDVAWGTFSAFWRGSCLGRGFVLCAACLFWLVFFVFCGRMWRGEVVVCVLAVLFHQ